MSPFRWMQYTIKGGKKGMSAPEFPTFQAQPGHANSRPCALLECGGMNLINSPSQERNEEDRAALAALEPAEGLKVDFCLRPSFL